MTLNTAIAVRLDSTFTADIVRRQAEHILTGIVNPMLTHPDPPTDVKYKHEPRHEDADTIEPGTRFGEDERTPSPLNDAIWNDPGQGLPAWAWVYYGHPELLHEDYDEDDETYWEIVGPDPRGAQIEIHFDTAYGYDHNGVDCSQLHAAYIQILYKVFSDAGVESFDWHNEYTGEWFEGLDGLDTLTKSGVDAANWFHNIVQPVIDAEAAVSGATVNWEGE